MYKRLTSQILHYLLDHYFESSADMARHFEMTERHMQRIMKEGADAKGGTVALDKAICYCAQRHISLDQILEECLKTPPQVAKVSHGRPAYSNLRVMCPDHLSPAGIETYHSMLGFLQRVSAEVCPSCEIWCNPWSGWQSIEEKDCFVGHIAREILDSLVATYSEGDVNA